MLEKLVNMIFASYNYKEYNKNNVHSLEKWCLMINKEYKYCANWNFYKTLVFWYHFYIKKLSPIYLPSEHPYWNQYVIEDFKRTAKRIEKKLEETGDDPYKLKVAFGMLKKREDILLKIESINKTVKQCQQRHKHFFMLKPIL